MRIRQVENCEISLAGKEPMVVVGNLGRLRALAWISLRVEKGLARSSCSGVMAATRLRTVSSEFFSNARRLAIEALLASRAAATAGS